MKTNIFVNLAVKDLEKSKAFFSALGYTFNPQFTDERAACMVIDENIFTMLVSDPFFEFLTNKKVLADHPGQGESTIALNFESKEKVDEWANKALSLGGTENPFPKMEGMDFMYSRSINDLDGHIWEVLWMDPKVIQKTN